MTKRRNGSSRPHVDRNYTSQVSVGHIVPGGAAEVDGQLRAGDEIVMVDNESVLGSSHHRVVELMTQASSRGVVGLAVRRRIDPYTQGEICRP